ncbi:hypothetical protein QYF36_026004 [Acer negundo]|nr:hypothetical protein QYF36_026004 [Acer negundo]
MVSQCTTVIGLYKTRFLPSLGVRPPPPVAILYVKPTIAFPFLSYSTSKIMKSHFIVKSGVTDPSNTPNLESTSKPLSLFSKEKEEKMKKDREEKDKEDLEKNEHNEKDNKKP